MNFDVIYKIVFFMFLFSLPTIIVSVNYLAETFNDNFSLLFEKILSYSNPNFNLLSFLMLDDIFEKLDINIKLILDTEFWDDLLSCNLKLESNCDEILKKLFYPNIIYLKDNFESF